MVEQEQEIATKAKVALHECQLKLTHEALYYEGRLRQKDREMNDQKVSYEKFITKLRNDYLEYREFVNMETDIGMKSLLKAKSIQKQYLMG